MPVSTGMGAFQEYQDAAYQQAQRNIAPQQEMQGKKFEQQMLNKGLQPGSKAYNLAQSQMQRGQNDQNQAANFGAMQFGQQAQAQEFGQDFQNRTMSMQKDQFGRTLITARANTFIIDVKLFRFAPIRTPRTFSHEQSRMIADAARSSPSSPSPSARATEFPRIRARAAIVPA